MDHLWDRLRNILDPPLNHLRITRGRLLIEITLVDSEYMVDCKCSAEPYKLRL